MLHTTLVQNLEYKGACSHGSCEKFVEDLAYLDQVLDLPRYALYSVAFLFINACPRVHSIPSFTMGVHISML